MKSLRLLLISGLMMALAIGCHSVESRHANTGQIVPGKFSPGPYLNEKSYVIQEMEDVQITGEASSYYVLGLSWGDEENMAKNNALATGKADGLFITRTSKSRVGFFPLFWRTTVTVFGKPIRYKYYQLTDAEMEMRRENDRMVLDIEEKKASLKNLWVTYASLLRGGRNDFESGILKSEEPPFLLTWWSDQCDQDRCSTSLADSWLPLRIVGDIVLFPYSAAAFLITGNSFFSIRQVAEDNQTGL